MEKSDMKIKEYHFHVYWFQTDEKSTEAAMALREKILSKVGKDFVLVCPGVTEEMLPGLDTTPIPEVNKHPRGPHPCGSFECWVPQESFAKAMSFFLAERGNLSILIHPLTSNAINDHTLHPMWLGAPFRLNVDALHVEDDTPQYPELQMGYSAPENESFFNFW